MIYQTTNDLKRTMTFYFHRGAVWTTTTTSMTCLNEICGDRYYYYSIYVYLCCDDAMLWTMKMKTKSDVYGHYCWNY